MTSGERDPFAVVEPKGKSDEIVLRYLRWGVRHPHLVTLAVLVTNLLLFVVVWQLFGLIVGIISVSVVVVIMAAYRLSFRHATRR